MTPTDSLGSQQTAPASPAAARVLMMATYLVGAVGLFIGFGTVNTSPASLSLAVLLVVVCGGGLSFVRHSLFAASDAARIGWTTPGRNNFQIEVGIANFAWAAVALLAILFDWGLAVESAMLLTFGMYLAGSASMLLFGSAVERSRALGPVIGMAVFGVMQIVLGALGLAAR
jgi:hypothetical protein